MEPKLPSLEFQHPACHDCLWHKRSQFALNALVADGEQITEATIYCEPKNTDHALVSAFAEVSDRGDPRAQTNFVLTYAVLYCVRREKDPSFILIEDID
ncbi:MAG: hypothetical protein AAB557_04055 [Patescibacteria group bacterium]